MPELFERDEIRSRSNRQVDGRTRHRRILRSRHRSSRHDFIAEIDDLQNKTLSTSPISFDVRKGEILGIAGLVGAGRSEAAQAIFGVDRVGGRQTFRLDGKQVKIRSARDAIRNGIYLVPEDRRIAGLIVDMPIRENITLPALSRYSSAGLVSKSRERKRAKEMCQNV